DRSVDGYIAQQSPTTSLLDGIDKVFEERARVENLTGLRTLGTWGMRHPIGNQMVVGVVRLWPAASEQATRAVKDARPPPPPAAAVAQVTGLKIDAHTRYDQDTRASSADARRSTSISEEQRTSVQRSSGGIIKRYDIISVEPDGGSLVALLRVDVEHYTASGL